MTGKKIMYVHGFGSSASSGTVGLLRETFTETGIIAYDLPVDPYETMALLREACRCDQPDLIIGTSMGGMYAEQLYGFDRICVNPAMQIADSMAAHGLTGKQRFFNPRQDGQQEFYVDKAMVKRYREVSEQRFSGVDRQEQQRVYGLFGDEDDTVDTYDLFREHYPQSIHFHGGHRITSKTFMHYVVPVVRWIDDRQAHRQRPIVYIDLDTLYDSYKNPASSAHKAYEMLTEHYQVFVVVPTDEADFGREWTVRHLSAPAWHRVVYTDRPDLLYGDYYVTRKASSEFMSTCLEFGTDEFKNWESVIFYFGQLGGQ